MPFDPLNIALPVIDIVPQVRQLLEVNNTLIVNAPPGAGKSTLLPLALLEEIWLKGKKILMLEPRRLAAKTIATRMSELYGEQIGATIGYRIRFESRISAQTRIEVVTEGILTRMLHQDNALENVGMVIFDEFHERSLHADVALALCRDAQQLLRPDLRLLIMSATLNMPQLSNILKAPVAVSEGKAFPVEIIYTSDADETLLPELCARTILLAAQKHPGDILVFLPGEGEIKKCASLVAEQLPDFKVHPLYGQLPHSDQLKAILPDKTGKRKVVLATSIAETSLTIEGIKVVVDSGFGRSSRFDPKSGLSRLETARISQDSADQRAGRAGRLAPGVCYRLWTNATQQRLAAHRVPEMLEADLTSMVLDLAQWGVTNAEDLTWLTPPPKTALTQARETLEQLECLSNSKITSHGKKIHQLACHPRIAHMLLHSEANHLQQLAADVAALLEERDPLPRDSGIDINLRIEALRRFRLNNGLGRMSRIEKVASFYRKMLKVEADNGPADAYDTGLLLAYAYPERIAAARPGNNAQFQLANGKIAVAGHKDDLAHEAWLAVAHMDLRDGLGKIFLAAPLNPKDLLPMVKEKEIISWDSRKGGLIARTDLRIGNIVLQSKPLPAPNEEQVLAAICEAIANEGENLLNFDTKMLQLQNRILSLKKWNPLDDWPDVNTPELLKSNQNWLGIYLKGAKKTEDLKKINLADCLLNSLEWEKQKALELLAPEKLKVPSGSFINIQYYSNGAIPVLSVRLQEVFGIADTPLLNAGKNPVVMHLLSPGYKPVQITSDLRSFWNNMYFEVKKELQRRYPKHAWPDDPWTAAAVAKGRSQK